MIQEEKHFSLANQRIKNKTRRQERQSRNTNPNRITKKSSPQTTTRSNETKKGTTEIQKGIQEQWINNQQSRKKNSIIKN